MTDEPQADTPAMQPKPTPPPVVPTIPKIKIPRINFSQTQEIIGKIEEQVGAKVIVYYVSPASRMTDNHPEIFYDHLRNMGDQENLALILVSSGGSPTSALRIATILREYCKELTIFIPSVAASAATLLSLAGDKIYMSPAGFLTAIDLSLNHGLNPRSQNGASVSVSADQIQRVTKFLQDEGSARDEKGVSEGSYRTLFKYVHPLVVGEIDRASSVSELIANKIMKMHPESFGSEDKIKIIANHLVKNYPSHGFPILYKEALELGLPVEKTSKELAGVLYDLVKLLDVNALLVTTHFQPSYYHVEEFPIIIESKGKRITKRYSLNRRFNPVAKGWVIENDNSQWVAITPGKKTGKPFEMTTIDVIEEQPVPEKPEERIIENTGDIQY